MAVKLSGWARRNGVHYQTAWLWAKNGQMPVPVVKTATGRYLVLAENAPVGTGRAVAYCRVSSADRKADLERQAGRVAAGATALELSITATGRRIVVLDDVESTDDLVRDMTEILTSFCARLYARRSANRKPKAAMLAVEVTL